MAAFSGGALLNPKYIIELEGLVKKVGFSILQGFTDTTTTQFTVDVPKTQTLYYEVIDSETAKKFSPVQMTSATRDKSEWRVDKIMFNELYLGGKFQLIVRDEKNKVLDTREFATLDINAASARIALISCTRVESSAQKAMWQLVEASQPDLMFFLGDNVYGDLISVIHGPDFLWKRYIDTRAKLRIYHTKKLIPAFSIWDDHDFGHNNVKGDYKYKAENTVTFNAFYAQEVMSSNFAKGPGVSSVFRGYGHKFVFLDGRSYRGLPSATHEKGFMGDEQMAWLQNELSGSAEPAVISSGSQFFGRGDSYKDHAPEELEDFCKMLSSLSNPCIFTSGDVHFSEISHTPNLLDYNSFELTSSCLHSSCDPKLPNNPNRIQGVLKENFMILEVQNGQSSYRVNGMGRFRNQQYIQELNI
jgi:alkaline phosphatase D